PGFLLSQYFGAREFKGNRVYHNRSVNDARRNDYGAIHLWSPEELPIRDTEIVGNEIRVAASGTGRPRALYLQSATRDLVIARNRFVVDNCAVAIEVEPGQCGLVFRENVVDANLPCLVYWEGRR